MALALILLNGPDFNDETEKLLAAELIRQGGRLYQDIFVQHGPMAYIPAHLLHMLVPAMDVAYLRPIPIALSLGAICAIVRSPAFRSDVARYAAATIFTIGLASTLAIYSLVMNMYQVYAGFLFVVLFANLVFPLLANELPSRNQALVAGASAAAIVWCAISFAVAIVDLAAALVLFAVFSPKRGSKVATLLCWAALGGASVSIAVAVWLGLFGSFTGLFVDHIYLNLTYYRHYLGFGFWNPLHLLYPGTTWNKIPLTMSPSRLGQIFTHVLFSATPFLILLLGVTAYLRRSFGRKILAYLVIIPLLGIGVLWMNPRFSMDFASATYAIALLGLVALIAPACFDTYPAPLLLRGFVVAGVSILAATAAYAQIIGTTFLYFVPTLKYYTMEGTLRRETSPEMTFLRTVVSDDGRVAQVPFNLNFYIRSGRLPALGVFYWMPWMNDYSHSPLPQMPLAFCDDLKKVEPGAIMYDPDGIWGNRTDDFAGCVKDLLRSRYLRVPRAGQNVWVRVDLVAANVKAARAAVLENLDTLDINRRVYNDIILMRSKQSRLQWNGDICVGSRGEHGMTASSCTPESSELEVSGQRILNAASGECLEIEKGSKDKGGTARFWPCIDNASNQMFDVLGTGDHQQIRNVFSQLCLIPRDGMVVQNDCETEGKWRWPASAK